MTIQPLVSKSGPVDSARDLFAIGLSRAEVVSSLRREFGISRAGAYQKAAQAHAYHLATETEPAAASVEDLQEILAMCKVMMINAFKDGNAADYSRLSREYKSTAAMVGLISPESEEQSYFLQEMCNGNEPNDTDLDE